MTDYLNTIKSLEATLARFSKERSEIYALLGFRGIRCKNLASGVRRLVKRMNAAKKLLK